MMTIVVNSHRTIIATIRALEIIIFKYLLQFQSLLSLSRLSLVRRYSAQEGIEKRILNILAFRDSGY